MNQNYCEKCGMRPASVFYEENRNGKVTKIQLCSHCAGEMGLLEQGKDSLFSFPLFFDQNPSQSGKVCPNCGMSLSAIQKGGKFGCSACYDTFSSVLDLTPFIGSGFQGQGDQKEEKKEEDPISKLKKELIEAVKREEYEKAAALRDKIRAEEGKR